MTQLIKEKYNKVVLPGMKKKFGYKNNLMVPKIQKVMVHVSTGSLKDKKKIEVIKERLMAITGQKPSPRLAKKSIASFKLREGATVGYLVTLRGGRMNSFLDKLINVAFPRTRDFKGIKKSSIDEMGNLSVGIKEHTVFPETSDEDLSNVFGLEVTVVTSAKNKEEALELFTLLSFPFKKELE